MFRRRKRHCGSVPSSFRRGGVLSIFFSLLCLCIFVRTHRCAPTFVCPCVLLSYCLAVGADWQLKLSLFFVIKREYPQGVGDKTNCSVAFNRFFILPPKFTCKFLVPLSEGQLFLLLFICLCLFAVAVNLKGNTHGGTAPE